MYSFDRAMHMLDKIQDSSRGKGIRRMKELILDPEFLKWVYLPDSDSRNPIQDYQKVQERLLSIANMKFICDAIADEDYRVDRALSTLLYDLACSAVDLYNEQSNILKEADRRKYSNREWNELKDTLNDYLSAIQRINRTAKLIVKPSVKLLSSDTRLSKSICRLGFWYVPGPKYINTDRCGLFLKALLTAIYEEVAVNGFSTYGWNLNWSKYFGKIFGDAHKASIATLILLEGAKNIDKYQGTTGMAMVRECWDSLTQFALTELDNSPDAVRDHMMDLYLKRLDVQFKNKENDLRIDILKLPYEFKRLAKTVEHYRKRIVAILDSVGEEKK